MTLIKTNMKGEEQGTRDLNYSFLGRFMNQQNASAPKIVEVSLPGKMSQHLSNRLIYWKGKPYRLDVFGGHRMKAKSDKAEDILRSQSSEDYGSLISIPLSETAQDSAFTQLMQNLFPYKESFFYFQRALSAQPKNGNTSNLLEGKFRIQVFKNHTQKETHPFV
nr:hypothetical protein [Candidatus Hamiltonella defensa]